MTTTIKYVIAIVAIASVAFMFGAKVSNTDGSVGGVYSITERIFNDGIDITGSGVLKVDGSTVINTLGAFVGVSTPTSLTVGTGGTAIDLITCSSATTWDPGVVGSTTVATTDVTVSGFTLGDVVIASLATSTQGLNVSATASTTGVVRVTLSQPDFDAVAVNLATSTVRVCAISN